jgi:hypothetical protein
VKAVKVAMQFEQWIARKKTTGFTSRLAVAAWAIQNSRHAIVAIYFLSQFQFCGVFMFHLFKTGSIFAALGITLVSSIFAVEDQGKQVFTDAQEAGPAYQFQGEYVGTAPDDDSIKVGVQIIAEGNDEYLAKAYIGGLPGEGWNPGDNTHQAKGKLEGDHVLFQTPDDSENKGYGKLKDGTLVIYSEDNQKLFEMQKVERKSTTLGAKPPENAIVLFDGTSADHFENGKLVEGELLGATNCSSKEKFGDHTLHIEFRTPFMPAARGQGRGNSGVYMQERYELQVLDSFGLSGENNECGGIYQIGKPLLNMCYPPLSWQTYDIDFTAAKYEGDKKVANARVTIRHNGITIHDNLELPKETPGRFNEENSPGGLFLQDHGNPVAFRNIWVVKK